MNWRVSLARPVKLRTPKVFAWEGERPACHRSALLASFPFRAPAPTRGQAGRLPYSLRAELGTRWNASLPWKGGAWLLPRALVHTGEAGFEGIDAGGLSVKSGQQFPVVGVQFLQQGKVVGM